MWENLSIFKRQWNEIFGWNVLIYPDISIQGTLYLGILRTNHFWFYSPHFDIDNLMVALQDYLFYSQPSLKKFLKNFNISVFSSFISSMFYSNDLRNKEFLCKTRALLSIKASYWVQLCFECPPCCEIALHYVKNIHKCLDFLVCNFLYSNEYNTKSKSLYSIVIRENRGQKRSIF